MWAVLGPSREQSQVRFRSPMLVCLGWMCRSDSPAISQEHRGFCFPPGKQLSIGTGGYRGWEAYTHVTRRCRRLRVRDKELLPSTCRENAQPSFAMSWCVSMRVSNWPLHIDADEANGCGCGPGTTGTIVRPESQEQGHDGQQSIERIIRRVLLEVTGGRANAVEERYLILSRQQHVDELHIGPYPAPRGSSSLSRRSGGTLAEPAHGNTRDTLFPCSPSIPWWILPWARQAMNRDS